MKSTPKSLRLRKKILQATRFINNDPRLFGLYLTSFACGPDSFILHFFNHEMARTNRPYLELELNDLGGQPLVRRVFPPVEYAGGAADFAHGMPANAEWNVKLFLDASAVNAGGYNLYLFYP